MITYSRKVAMLAMSAIQKSNSEHFKMHIWYYIALVLIVSHACSTEEDGIVDDEQSTESNTSMSTDDSQSNQTMSSDTMNHMNHMNHTTDDSDVTGMAGSEGNQDMGIVSDQGGGGSQTEDMGMPEERENLIANPSFEEQDNTWSIWGGASRVDSNAHAGTWALRATNGNGAEQRVIGLIPNATYRLSGWGKTESDEPMLVGVKEYGGDQVQLIFTQATYATDSLTFTMGAGNTEAVIFAYKHQDNEPGYADALSLVLESSPMQPQDPVADLELVWSDEFDGSGPLDANKWRFEEGFQRNQELQWYQQDNAFREDGMLVIEGRRENRPNPTYMEGSQDWRTRRPTIEYTSASVITADLFDFQYGRLEVRAKVTNYTGTWPAIWTLGVNCEWPSSGEVDVMENYGGKILANFAWGTNQRWNAQWNSSHHPVSQWEEGWTDDFHIWTLDWTEDQMTIRLDDVVLNTMDLRTVSNGSAKCAGQNPFRQPHYLLLNLALGGAGGSVENLAFPTRYIIDYVRVYQ